MFRVTDVERLITLLSGHKYKNMKNILFINIVNIQVDGQKISSF